MPRARSNRPPADGMVASAGSLDPTAQLAHDPGARVVCELMTNADDDRHRPVDHVDGGHEGEPHIPGEPANCVLTSSAMPRPTVPRHRSPGAWMQGRPARLAHSSWLSSHNRHISVAGASAVPVACARELPWSSATVGRVCHYGKRGRPADRHPLRQPELLLHGGRIAGALNTRPDLMPPACT